MHAASEYIYANWLPRNTLPRSATAYVLTGKHVGPLTACLHADARDYLFTALVTFGGALRGMTGDHTTWPVAQLYYSMFYALRSQLALHGQALFYLVRDKRTPFSLRLLAGEQPRKLKGTTHSAVIDLFRTTLPDSDYVTQLVNGLEPVTWLMSKREEANYQRSRCYEPDWPPALAAMDASKLDGEIAHYLNPANRYLAFDAAHCALALPIVCILDTAAMARDFAGTGLDEKDLKAASGLLRDKRNRVLSHLVEALRDASTA